MHGIVDGEELTAEEFNWFFLLLINAGGDTTRNAVGGGMLALFEHPDQRAKLQADLDRYLPTATDEILRWCSPVIYMRRTALKDTEVRGVPIAEGDALALYYGAANRDEEVFSNAHTFDIAREPNDHIAFGGGVHFCLGVHVARVEIMAMLREILTRLPDIEPTGGAEWLESTSSAGRSTCRSVSRRRGSQSFAQHRYGLGITPLSSGSSGAGLAVSSVSPMLALVVRIVR